MAEEGDKKKGGKGIVVYVIVSLVILGIIGAIYYFSIANKEEPDDDQRPLRVLIVGNDVLHHNDIPNMLREVARMSKSWRELEVSCVAQGDYSLKQHLEEKTVKDILRDEKFDFVILQERWLSMLQEPDYTLEATKKLAKMVRQKGTRVAFMTPWADSGDELRQEVVSAISRKLAERLSIDLAPAGDVMFAIMKKHPEVNPFGADKHHVSPIGSWLAASTIYIVVTNQKPKLKSKEFTYASGSGDEPQVPIEGDLATDVENITWELSKQENKGRKLGPGALPPAVMPGEE